MSLISNLFSHSPIRPLQRHMKAAVACAREIGPFVDAMAAGDLQAMRVAHDEINRLEHVADELKNELRSHLPKRLFMAIERRDMLEILDAQDSIADRAQDVAEIANLRGMKAPPALVEPLLALTRKVIETCEKAEQVINELDELVETGFGHRESGRVDEMILELGHLESEADELALNALRSLFGIEEELGVGTYFWYELIGWIGNMADHAERVGNRLRLLIAT